MAKRPSDLPPKPQKRESPPAPGSAYVGPRRKLTPMARLASQVTFVVLVIILIGILVYPILRPILNPDPVTTRFSQLPLDQQKAINALPVEQRDLLLQVAEQNPQQAVDTAAMVLQPPLLITDELRFFISSGATPTLMQEGSFTRTNALYGASGKAQLYKNGVSYYLNLVGMDVTAGPELHVAFALEAAPDIAARATWLDIGPLKGPMGNMVYPLPNTFNPGSYKSVVIFDAKYGTLSSVAVFGS